MVRAFDPELDDYEQVARLIFDTDPIVSRAIFGEEMPSAVRAITKLMARPYNPFYCQHIQLIEAPKTGTRKHHHQAAGMYISFQATEQKKWPELRTILLSLAVPQRIRFLLFGLPMLTIFVSRKLEDGDHYLSNVCVEPSHRRSGYGRQLVQHAIARALENGAKRVVLDVAVNNHPALGLYRSLGFQSVNRTGFRYGPVKVGVYRMLYRPHIQQ